MNPRSLIKVFLFLNFIGHAAAAEIAGVKIDDKARVGNAELVLNGAGLRKRVFFQVYAIGLYLPKVTTNGIEVINSPGPKRIAIHMLRDVDADQFTGALADGIRANHSEAEAKALEPRVEQLAASMKEIGEAKKGMVITLDWAGAETELRVQGKRVGTPIAGEEFYRALLRIWLGEKPVQDDLKKALLGQP
jgi:chalcone isomerase-like protein